jgi:hypothetical protein
MLSTKAAFFPSFAMFSCANSSGLWPSFLLTPILTSLDFINYNAVVLLTSKLFMQF